ncbi:ATP-binding cassette subfamily B protein [Fontibacillus solani]|uniref:ATP-binding cassette subfamily B protein n=1 Tax=Fontibacillus solani TaxID=1572857 RepID=A0A7W3XT03_9BACL|nr:ABC transporter ATP-binding protein [Fontibacillus solani]MBA9087111.1 ATP-binding cassette subfamily B protein [Fontibacillus solani]
MMKIENRSYKILDFIKIPLSISPGMVILQVLFDGIISSLVPTFQVLATASFIDTAIRIFQGQAERNQIVLPILWVLLFVSYNYLTALMGLVREKLNLNLTEVFRAAVTEKRARLEYCHVENNETWDLIERVGKDPAEQIGKGFRNLVTTAGLIIRIGSVLMILLLRVWWAPIVIMAFSIPLLMLAAKTGKQSYEAAKEAAKYTRRATYYQDVLTGRDYVEERALFGYSSVLNERYEGRFLTAYGINMKMERSRYMKMSGSGMITVLVAILVAGVLLAPLGSGQISIGLFMGLVTATIGLVPIIVFDLTNVTNDMVYGREYMRDLTAFGGLSESPGATDLPANQMAEPNCIELRDVSFAYPGTDVMILKGLSLKLFSKRHYAFVGVNGAGKTTITKLLTGLYDNYAGEILIDGKNIRDFSQAELKSLFSIVYQDFAKYQVPMVDSIGLGDVRDMPMENVDGPLKVLGLNRAVSKMRSGIKTPLGRIYEDGIDLSGGQWQKVAIARSLVSRAPMHILDEPTAALDPVAESELYELFRKASKNKSTIFITHRLGAARIADEVFVIADGRVSEQGTHKELMDKGGIYAEMFEAQRGWYA